MLNEVQYCQKIIETKFKEPLKMSDKDEKHFNATYECHICGVKYTSKDIRVRDHCHITEVKNQPKRVQDTSNFS